MRQRTLFASLLCLALATANAQATAIVVIRSAGRVIIAADSKLLTVGGNKESELIEKIRKVEGYYYASAGSYFSSRGFSVDETVRRTFAGGGGLAERVARFNAAIEMPLGEVVTLALEKHPDQRDKIVAKDGTVLAVAFVGVERGAPVAFAVNWQIVREGPIKLEMKLRSCPGNCGTKVAKSATAFYTLGASDEMTAYINKRGRALLRNPIQGARDIINEAIRVRPDIVGGPVKVLEITSAGARWRD